MTFSDTYIVQWLYYLGQQLSTMGIVNTIQDILSTEILGYTFIDLIGAFFLVYALYAVVKWAIPI